MNSLPPIASVVQRICPQCGIEHTQRTNLCRSCYKQKKFPKKCFQCGVEHERRGNLCHECQNVVSAANARKNYDPVKEANRYLRNREAVKRNGKIRYQRNKANILKRTKAYYHNHEAKMIGVKREWRQNNKARLAEYFRCRTAKKMNATIGDPKEIRAFYEMVRTVEKISCYWCGKAIPKGGRTVDHIHPIIKGGAHAMLNLCCACESCNKGKMAKLPQDFAGQYELFTVASPQLP